MHGTYDLIKAMDHKKIPVNIAHQIAKRSPEKQEQLVAMDLKAIKKELAERK